MFEFYSSFSTTRTSILYSGYFLSKRAAKNRVYEKQIEEKKRLKIIEVI